MIVYPNCKINLGLRILRKRDDGYHDLETVFYPVKFNDLLEIIQAGYQSAQPVQFTQSGLSISGNPEDNLCVKAWQLLKKEAPELPPVLIHLHKLIPMGAGLGGGSADGAFALKQVAKQFNLKLPEGKLEELALQLGSDCPFFLLNNPAYATGRGEQLEPISLELSGYKLVLVNPGIHVPTGKAFAGVSPGIPSESVKDIIQLPVSQWKDRLINDFESSVFEQFPEIGKIKDQLYNAGAIYASMSGSGSTVFGLFEKAESPTLSFPSGWFVKWLNA